LKFNRNFHGETLMPDSWTFVYAADIQPGSPRSFRFNPRHRENWETAKAQILAIQPEFVLYGGDLTRDGSIHAWELEAIRAELEAMGLPYHVIPGNMDTGNKHTRIRGADPSRDDLALNITSAQLHNFEKIFGPAHWSFVHKNVRVSGFCDMLVNSGLPEEEQLWAWLEAQTKLPPAQHHLWLMHYALFINAPDERNFAITRPDEYLSWYFAIDNPGREELLAVFTATGTTRVVTGHIHCRKEHCARGIHFDLAPAVAFPQWGDRWPDGSSRLGFFRYDVAGETMMKTFVPLTRESVAEGAYGPGGHPRPEQRDYSLARERRPPAITCRPGISKLGAIA
jgi:hypothetical protein